MQVNVEHRPSYALGIVDLEPNEQVKAETGAMVSMTTNLKVESSMQGGFLKSAMRSMLGGESFFVNTFTAQGGPGQISFAPSLPGDITTVAVSGELFVQSGSFLASEMGIDIETKWGGATSFFSSEGLFLLNLKGSGQALVSSFGAIHKLTLDGTNDVIIDTGHVVAFEPTVQWKVKKVAGFITSLMSGEGLVCEFSGTGDVWLQTRSNQAFLDWLVPRLPTAHTSSGGRGGVGGILGNVLSGR